jgi:outer membrane protein, heavy metal efflux system
MKRHVAILAVLAAIDTGAPASAQTRPSDQHAAMAPRFLDPINGLTLEQAIAQALDQEPGLRAARADVDVARGARLQAGLRPNPTVSFAQQTEPGGTDAQTRVDVQWPLDLFRRTGRVNVAEREIEAAQHATADRERRLMSDVRMKFGTVLTAVRELSVIDDLVAATARQQTLMTARVDEGAAPPLERNMMRVELQRLEADRMLQAGRAEYALIELKRLLGLPADAPLTLRQDLEQVVQREIAPILPTSDNSIRDRPDVQEAQARVSITDARLDQARREGRVDLSLFGMYMRMDAGFPQSAFGLGGDLQRVHGLFHYIAAGVSVSLPLRDRKQGDITAAQAQRVGAEAQLEAARLTAQAEFAAARVRDEQARQALAVYSSEIRTLAKQNLDTVDQTYELGRMTLFDVLNERRRYLETERSYTNALREAYDARQALRTALGEVR